MVAETIGQRGRRGATMISIDIDHPDVEEFIDCKTDLSKVTGANISVRVNDNFMKAVENNEDYYLHWPCKQPISSRFARLLPQEYNELKELGNIYVKKVKARDIFYKLVKNNWDYAEPGILYWDRIKNWNVLSEDKDFEYAGVNP